MPKLLALTPSFTLRVLQSVPLLEAGEVHRATQTTRIPAGPAVGVAQVVRNLGHHVEIGGFIGRVNGRFVQRKLEQQGLVGHYVWCDGEIGSTVIISETQGRTTTISEQQMFVGPEQVAEFAAMIASVRDQFDWISFSGNLPPGASADSYTAICEAARPAKLALDIHGSAFPVFARQNADVLWLDRLDVGAVLGREITSLAEARVACLELQRCGNRVVVMSLDERTILGCEDDQCLMGATPEYMPVSGDADAIFATLLAALMDGRPLDVALRQGIAASCASGETFDVYLPYVDVQVIV